MKYRIVVETEASGIKWYSVQKKYLFYFWRYLREVRDMSMYAHKISWHTLSGAEAHIQSEIDSEYKNSQKKIIKREYINK
jgi:hypothetical protein